MKSDARDRAREIFAMSDKAAQLGILDDIKARAQAGKEPRLEKDHAFSKLILEELGPNWLKSEDV